MTDETRNAFEHPEARSRATATELRDRISLRDHVVSVEIGAFQAERGATQRLSFDIVAELHPAPPAGDDVDRILSYDRLTEAVATELASERLDLLETLAERIADRVLAEPQAERVFVRIQKLDRGPGALGVEIVRSGPGALPPSAPAPRPKIVLVSREAAARPQDWQDALASETGSMVLCVESAERGPQVDEALARARIDLLALDQAAWMASVALSGIAVRDSRTELDWAIRRGEPSLWAPSRMVAAAVSAPETTEFADVALWLARTLDAEELLLVGLDLPQIDMPSRRLSFGKASA